MTNDLPITRTMLWLATGFGVILLGAIVVWNSRLLSGDEERSPWKDRNEALAMADPLLAQVGDPTPNTAAEAETAPAELTTEEQLAAARQKLRTQGLVHMLTIFAVSIFVGFEVITKVPPTLHTPLMSGSNAVSGITVVGAVILAASQHQIASFIALFAVLLAAINVVGGFLVTHRMLAMFKK